MTHILAIDQGTTSSRAIVFDAEMHPVATARQEFTQHFPRSGWVEHDAEEIWQSVRATCRDAIAQAGVTAGDIAGIGITNQRETTVIWDRKTGRPIHNAIVWQDRRTSEDCARLRDEGHEAVIRERTGLLLDPYFSGTKIAWLLDHVEGARDAAERGELAFGTIDSWLIWNLTERRVHVTDATNAARTMLYDIGKGAWDEDICARLSVPIALLPKVQDCAAEYGTASAQVFGAEIPILGVAGDQHAATIGQGCFEPGMMKSTYGTGCFALLNTGTARVDSQNRLLTTIAYQLDGQVTYALEGSIFIAGAVVQWLRDGLGVIEKASDSNDLFAKADSGQDLIIVPAFTGLGAPYWNAECRGAIYGLTRNSGPAELAKAALESVGYQTRDLIEAMRSDWPGLSETVLRVDGGVTASEPTMQFLADIIGAPVERPQLTETTALGAAWLAGQRAGLYPGMEAFAKAWRAERRFDARMGSAERKRRYDRWCRAVKATLGV